MRIANVNDRLVTFIAGRAVDAATESKGRFGPDPMSVYADWPGFRDWGNAVGAYGGGNLDLADVGAPVPTPAQIFAIGLNYTAHALEGPFGIPDQPAVFTKFPR